MYLLDLQFKYTCNILNSFFQVFILYFLTGKSGFICSSVKINLHCFGFALSCSAIILCHFVFKTDKHGKSRFRAVSLARKSIEKDAKQAKEQEGCECDIQVASGEATN